MLCIFAVIPVVLTIILLFANALPTNALQTNTLQVDVVYSYIDRYDPLLNLQNEGAGFKDHDPACELMYSMRSVLKNIPWIRKIYVVMPNETIRFIDERKRQKDNRIVYVRDKDLLGFDTTCSLTKEFNMYKLKSFGCATNVIYFNDDMFVGKEAQPQQFFDKDKPYILHNEPFTHNNYDEHSEIAKLLPMSDNLYDSKAYHAQIVRAYMYIYQLFGKNALTPKNLFQTNHNATPINLDELQELVETMQRTYPNANEVLNATAMNNKAPQFQELYMLWIANKYGRQVKDMSMQYYECTNTRRHFRMFMMPTLFCINTNAINKPTKTDVAREVSILRHLYPNPTIYER